jgi:Tol biopolymer transport system component
VSRGSRRLALSLAASVALATAPGVLAAPRPIGTVGGASALAPIPPVGPTQVVVFDRTARTTTVVSHDQAGSPGSESSSRPSVNSDGSRIAFESAAALRTEDSNGRADVYVWDRATGANQRISVGPGGRQANGHSRDPSISGDGSVVAFTSTARNLVSVDGLDGETAQLYEWRSSTGVVDILSLGNGGPASAAVGRPAVSLDGRVVAFQSTAGNLVQGDTNDVGDVFLHDLARGATIRASVRSTGGQVGAESGRALVSGDGGAVVFDSTAGQFVPGDTNRARDVFIRDLPPAVLVTPAEVNFGVVDLLAPVSQTVTVQSVGWTPVLMTPSTVAGANAGDFLASGDTCAGQLMSYGVACAIGVFFIPTETGERTAQLAINDTALDSPQIVNLIGGVPGPVARVSPEVGPPGIVAVVRGEGFPLGAQVTIRWDRGITRPLAPVVVGADRTFALAVLVFHHDQLGPRQLIVSAAPGGPSFPEITLPFLVVPTSQQPPGSDALLFLDPELQVIVRR